MNIQKQFGFASVVIILVIIGVLIVGGGIWYYSSKIAKEETEPQISQSTQPEEEAEKTAEEIKPFDCETDEDCFYKQLETCAISVTKAPVNPLELRFQFDIQGEKDENCLVQVSVIESPEDFPQLKDTEMQCKIPKKAPKETLAKIVGEDVTKKSQDNCKGTLMDLMFTDQSVILGIRLVLNWGNIGAEFQGKLTPEM